MKHKTEVIAGVFVGGMVVERKGGVVLVSPPSGDIPTEPYDSGWVEGTSAANYFDAGTSLNSWANPTNVLANNTSDAIIDNWAGGMGETCRGLFVGGFNSNWTIPNDITVTGWAFEFTLLRVGSVALIQRNVTTRVGNNSSPGSRTIGSALFTNANITNSAAAYQFGGDGSMWSSGVTPPTASELNSADFGCILGFLNNMGATMLGQTVNARYVRARVWGTVPA